KVTATRYTRKGILVRLKKDFYIAANKFEQLTEKDFFRLANIIQVPSYISLTSALSYYNLTTQQLRNTVESLAVKRTKIVKVKNIVFSYSLIKKEFYLGFGLVDNFFIASPEKALADAVYLTSLNKYSFDFEALNFKKINKQKVNEFLQLTNSRTLLFWEKICRRYKI
ncbi:MAG: hypothetical protein WC557_11175, partial [Ignavibacteriaceae bacterium]